MHELAGAYVLDALGEQERGEFEQHLAECDPCAAEVAADAETAVRLALAVAVPAPETLRAAVFAAIGDVPQEADSSATAIGDLRQEADSGAAAIGDVTQEPDSGGESDLGLPGLTASSDGAAAGSSAQAATTSSAGAAAGLNGGPLSGRSTGAPPSRPPSGPRGPVRPESRRTPSRQAFRVLALTCVVFGAAAAAFAWSTIRVHDRQVAAQNREQALTSILAAPDVHSATQQVSGGGVLTVYYSRQLGTSALVASGLPRLAGNRTYELWYLDGPGRPARPAGTSRFDAPQHDVVLATATLPTADLAITVEPTGGSKAPTTAPLATIPLS